MIEGTLEEQAEFIEGLLGLEDGREDLQNLRVLSYLSATGRMQAAA